MRFRRTRSARSFSGSSGHTRVRGPHTPVRLPSFTPSSTHDFATAAEDRAAGSILIEPELALSEDILIPDLAAWRRSRMPTLPDGANLELASDWVCEVLSPSMAKIDRTDKMTIYGREGVKHVWHVDPTARTLEIFRLDGPVYVRVAAHRDEAVVRAEPFDAAELDLALLWQR